MKCLVYQLRNVAELPQNIVQEGQQVCPSACSSGCQNAPFPGSNI